MEFSVQYREEIGKNNNRRLRKQGLVPGVIYGKGEPRKVSAEADKALRFIKSMKGAKKIFDLNLESTDDQEKKKVLIQDYQISNVGNKLMHVDFFEVSDDTSLSLEVPIVLLNEDICPAVKLGGVLQTIRRTVPVRCMVKDIPESIEIDLQELEFGESIHILDLDFPAGVNPIVIGRNFTVITVAGRMAEEEEEVVEIEEEELLTEEEAEAAAAAAEEEGQEEAPAE